MRQTRASSPKGYPSGFKRNRPICFEAPQTKVAIRLIAIFSAMFEADRSYIRGRLLTGECRGASPLCRGLGDTPNLKFPQEWGKEGVEKTLLNDLIYSKNVSQRIV